MAEVTATPAAPAKASKSFLAALSKRMNNVTRELNAQAPLLAKIAKEPDYGGRFETLTTAIPRQGVPEGAPGYTRQLGEKSWSMLNVARMARGLKRPEECPEEVYISNHLSEMFDSRLYSDAHPAGKSWMIPLHTSYLPQETTKQEKFVKELRQKMATKPLDWNEVNFLKSKGWQGNAHELELVTKNLGTVADTAGGTFVNPPQIIELLEMQYKMEAWSRAGASQIPMMPNGRAFISKINQGTTAFYADEGISFQNSLSQAVTGQLPLVAKKIAVLTALNNELLRFGMPATETMVRYDMARQAALFADAEMFAGTGGTHIAGLFSPAYTSQNPPWTQGVDAWINYTNSTPAPSGIGTNGNTFNPEDVDKMVNSLPDEITPDEICFLMTRTLFGGINSRRAGTAAVGDGGGPFVSQRLVGITDRISPDSTGGYRTVWSSNVPTNLAKGNSTTLTEAIVGRFPDWVIARLGVGEIVANSFDGVSWYSDSTSLRLIQQIDAGARYVASFAAYQYLLNA